MADAFTRFGKDKHLPSSKYVGDDFYDLQKEMETYLYQFEKAEDMIKFETDEDITIIDVNISQIHTWGLPKLTVSQEKMYKYEAVKDCIDCISGDIIGTRANYYYQYEEIIREIMCFINENSDEKIAFDEFWSVFAKKLTIEQLLKISSPLIMPNGDTPEIRQLKVINNLTKVIDEVLLEIDFAFSLDAIERIYSAVPELLYKLLNGVLEDCAVNDLNKIEGFQAIIFMLSDGVLTQPHYPEFTLAWLMQKDSYYGENDSIEVGRTYRVIHINCPVDVNVYSEDTGKMVASIIKDVPQEIEESYINTVINGDDEKIIILPADTNYKVEIIAIGNGTFNYTIDEYSYDEQGNTRIINYYDIPIISGDVLTSRLPAMNKDELYRENENGSSVLYSLMDNNNVEIVPDSELRGEAALEAVYNVKVLNGNEYGYVYGGGKYSIGSFAEIKAYPMYGGEFIGWYKGSELVSTEEKYRFPVKEDINLSAVFKEIQLYDISFEAGEGGMIENIPMKVPTGVNVLLNAIPSSGYEFLGWVASDNGTFENERASNTTYTVGSENVIIEAYFSKIEEEGKQDSDNIKSEPNDKFAEDMNTENESDNLVDLNTGATTHIYGIYSMITVIIVSVLTLKKRKV